tara:strand:+ start:23645 stop:25030 length:1386 start_codon:yes stop_codon:yes gene_type:complete
MTKFLDKKEQVYDLKLTSYGKYLLSIGQFKAVYYGFYDDAIIYDERYTRATGSELNTILVGQDAGQNYARKRIKEDTQYLESLVHFDSVETAMADVEENYYTADVTATQQEVKKDVFLFDSLIGDAHLEADARKLPAWKAIALQGKITSSMTEDVANDEKVPQIDMDLNYRKVVKYINTTRNTVLSDDPTPEDLLSTTNLFADNTLITLVPDDALLYIEELNTSILNKNLTLEIYEMNTTTPATHASGSLKFTANPGNTETVTLTNAGVSQAFRFMNTPALDTDVKIDTDVAMTMGNFATKVNAHATLNLNALNSGQYLYLRNNYPGSPGNQPRALITSTVATSALATADIIQFNGGASPQETMRKIEFKTNPSNVVDGYIVPLSDEGFPSKYITTSSVEYYFDLSFDQDINEKIACQGAQEFNKQSYYIDIDFNCDTTSDVESAKMYDLYGAVTEPEICQ